MAAARPHPSGRAVPSFASDVATHPPTHVSRAPSTLLSSGVSSVATGAALLSSSRHQEGAPLPVVPCGCMEQAAAAAGAQQGLATPKGATLGPNAGHQLAWAGGVCCHYGGQR